MCTCESHKQACALAQSRNIDAKEHQVRFDGVFYVVEYRRLTFSDVMVTAFS